MTTDHTPTLSSIVDQIDSRIEGIHQTGDPAEVAALARSREEIVDYAMREQRLRGLVDDILITVDAKESA